MVARKHRKNVLSTTGTTSSYVNNCANSPVHILRLWMKTYEYLWKYDILGMSPHKSQLYLLTKDQAVDPIFFFGSTCNLGMLVCWASNLYIATPLKKCRKVEDLEHMWTSSHLYLVSHFSASFFGGMKCQVSARTSLKKRSSSRNSSSLRGADNPI